LLLAARFDTGCDFNLPATFLAFFSTFSRSSLTTLGAECLRVDFVESGSDGQ
jgi:hypothetical protein